MNSCDEAIATGQDAGQTRTAYENAVPLPVESVLSIREPPLARVSVATGRTSESPARDLLPLVQEPLPSSPKRGRRRLLTGAEVILAAMMAGWERVVEALEAARDRLTDFPEFSLDLTEALQRNTTALIVCFAPLISLVAFIVPISGPTDVSAWQWLPVLFLLGFQCSFMFAPWSNSFLSDVWGDERVSKYFKIGLLAGTWQLLWLGVVPAFTSYFPLPWMPVIGCVTLLAIVGMIYYNLPEGKRSLGSRKKIAMVLVSIGSCVAVFGISYPMLYYFALKLNGFLRFWICLSFYVFRIVFEKVAKHYARLYCIDCYPMIVLFAMYAYEFFISSVISAVTEVWLAILLISLDLMENLYYIYCSYQVRRPPGNVFNMAPPEIRKNDPQRNGNEGLPNGAAHPGVGSRRAAKTTENDDDAEVEAAVAESPLATSNNETQSSNAEALSNMILGSGPPESNVTLGQQNSIPDIAGTGASVVGRPSDSVGDTSLTNEGGTGALEHASIPHSPGREQHTTAEPFATGRNDGTLRRDSSECPPSPSPSPLASSVGCGSRGPLRGDTDRSALNLCEDSVLRDNFVIDDRRTSAGRCSDGSWRSSRRGSVFEILADLVTGVNMETMAGMRDGGSKRALSIMTVAICKEVVEVLAPIQYLICSLVLRTFNPKLHDTFWDMTDEEFVRGIRRLLIDIAAETCLFVLLIVVIKRWLNESVIFIALRLGYQFFWPFLAMQVCLMTHYIDLQYSNAGMTFSFDFKWIGEKNTTWHGGNCYTTGNETIEDVC